MNPAAFGCKTCRYHGARRDIKAGSDHPQYKHGECSKAELTKYREAMAVLSKLEAEAYSAGLMVGPRTRGRKPKV